MLFKIVKHTNKPKSQIRLTIRWMIYQYLRSSNTIKSKNRAWRIELFKNNYTIQLNWIHQPFTNHSLASPDGCFATSSPSSASPATPWGWTKSYEIVRNPSQVMKKRKTQLVLVGFLWYNHGFGKIKWPIFLENITMVLGYDYNNVWDRLGIWYRYSLQGSYMIYG